MPAFNRYKSGLSFIIHKMGRRADSTIEGIDKAGRSFCFRHLPSPRLWRDGAGDLPGEWDGDSSTLLSVFCGLTSVTLKERASPNPQNLWTWPYLEKGSLSMDFSKGYRDEISWKTGAGREPLGSASEGREERDLGTPCSPPHPPLLCSCTCLFF